MLTRGFGHQGKGHAMRFEHVDKRLIRIEPITDDHDLEPGMRITNFTNKSFARRTFAVVFGVAIGLDNHLRGKRYHLTHSGMKHDGLQDLIRVTQLAFCSFVGQTAWAMGFFGRKVLRTIQCYQVMTAFHFLRQKLFTSLQVLEQNCKTMINICCVNGIHGLS